VQLLCRYDWPGNCLELRGVVGASLATALWSGRDDEGRPQRHRAKRSKTPPQPSSKKPKPTLIRSTLEMTHLEQGESRLSCSRSSRSRLYRKVKAYGLVPNIFPTTDEVHAALSSRAEPTAER